MSRAIERLILAQLEQLSAELRSQSARIDGIHTRLDTIVASLADLRRDFATHTHD